MITRSQLTRVLVRGAISLLGLMMTLAAPAQNAGVEQILVRPNNVVIAPAITPLQLTRMREIPTYGFRLGNQTVRFSFGEFQLLDRTLIARGMKQADKTVSTPSDQAFATTDTSGLNWADFHNVLYLMTPVRDQAERGSCHAMAATALMESLLKLRSMASGAEVMVNGKPKRIIEEIDLSEQWLMYKTKWRAHAANNQDCGDGGSATYDLETVKLYGHIPEVYWRWNPQHGFNDAAYHNLVVGDTANGPWNWKVVAQSVDGNPPASVNDAIQRRSKDPKSLESFKVKNVVEGDGRSAGVDYIKDMIINRGLPVAVSVPWPTARMLNGNLLYVPDAVKDKSEDWCWKDTEWDAGANKNVSKWFRGGHVVLIMGVGRAGTPAEGLYAFKNSWSRWYGNNGYGYFTENFLKKFLWCTNSCELVDN